MNEKGLAELFEQNRQRFRSIAQSIVGDDAEDVVQDVFLKFYSKLHKSNNISLALVDRSIKNRAIDIYRQKAKVQTTVDDQALGDKHDVSAVDSLVQRENVEQKILGGNLSDLEREIWLKRTADGISYSEISLSLSKNQAAVRKAFQRAKDKIFYGELFSAITGDNASDFNRLRMLEKDAIQVAKICASNSDSVESLLSIFKHKELSRAIQNATWIISALCKTMPHYRQHLESFLVGQLVDGDLYRGNKNYISEALLDINYRKYIYLVRREFLLPLRDFEDRITPSNFSSEEVISLKMPCIFDVKRVRPIGGELKETDIAPLLDDFLKGNGSVDYRRTLAFELLRVHPWNSDLAQKVIWHLPYTDDQTNAYYVMKYLLNWGIKDHPELFTERLVQKVENIAKIWDTNPFFFEVAKIIHTRVNGK